MTSINHSVIEKLTGRENYATWKFAVKTYLEHEDLWNCIESDSEEEIDIKRDLRAKSKIILLVDPINYVHIQEATNAREVWYNLKRAFDDSGLSRKVGLLRDLITTNLDSCNNVEEYVMKIMSTAHKLRNIGFIVEDEWLGTLLLAGLPENYKPMIMAMESSGVPITADFVKTKILQDVKTSDSDVFYSKHNKKSTYVKSQGFNKDSSNKASHYKGPRCFSCNKYGHISKQCRYKRKTDNSATNDNNFSAVFSATSAIYNANWYVDSGASMHMTKHRDWLYDEISPPVQSINVADNKTLIVKGCGKVNIHIKEKDGTERKIQVRNVLYIPDLATNLLSVSQMTKNGCEVKFYNNDCKIYKNNKEILSAKSHNNMYIINTEQNCALMSISNEQKPFLWHQRMGHLNFSDLQRMPENVTGLEKLSPMKETITCTTCLEGKQTRQPFKSVGTRASKLLEIIHSDLCGPMETKSLGGSKYFLTFIDDFSRKVFIYVLNSKTNILEKFKEFMMLAEKQLNTKIEVLRTDNGKEYVNSDLKNFLKNRALNIKQLILTHQNRMD